MQNRGKVAILGGDDRQFYQKQALERLGWESDLWGLGAGKDTVMDWQSAIHGAAAILLPLPASADGVRIRCANDAITGLRFSTLLNALDLHVHIFGGKLSEIWKDMAAKKGIPMTDYYEWEALQVKNALPTVEGAILYALQELPVTLDGTEVAVIGYGRIASLLSEKLLLLGASVTVYARKETDLLHAALRHLQTVRIIGEGGASSLCKISPACRMVFNTVPQRIFSESILEQLPKSCILMELASPPGGYDPVLAASKGLHTVFAPALPGRCFPESAGKILAEVLSDRLQALFDDGSYPPERKDEG